MFDKHLENLFSGGTRIFSYSAGKCMFNYLEKKQ